MPVHHDIPCKDCRKLVHLFEEKCRSFSVFCKECLDARVRKIKEERYNETFDEIE
jgi:hypothetical protein